MFTEKPMNRGRRPRMNIEIVRPLTLDALDLSLPEVRLAADVTDASRYIMAGNGLHPGYATPGGNVTRPRAADDFATIRARMEELRRERARVPAEQDHPQPLSPRPDHAASSGLQNAGPRRLPSAVRQKIFR
jgi:hypothetical protein